MKVGLDGSLCRITSSTKDAFNNIRIVKVPDDQLKESEPSYKLVVIGAENDEYESPSEKSEEEMSEEEEEFCDTQLSAKNFETEKDTDAKEVKVTEINKPENEEIRKERYKNKRYKGNYFHDNYNSFFRRNGNTKSGKIAKNYSKPILNNSYMEENNYTNYNSTKKKFNTSSSHGIAYNKPIQVASLDNIPTWINPPIPVLNPLQNYPHSMYVQYSNMVEPVRQSPINSHPENSGSIGLLGDSPYYHLPQNFQLNNQNDSYIHEQASAFSHRISNFPSSDQTDDFNRDSNYWNSDYPEYHSGNYQRSVLANTPVSVPHNKNYHPYKKRWKNRNRQKSKGWNRKKGEPQKGKRNPPGHFDCKN